MSLSRAVGPQIARLGGLRSFCSGRVHFQSQTGKFSTPKEYISEKHQESLQQEEFETSLLQGEFKYDPKTLTENVIDPATKKPMPLNVELLKYKPIRLPKTHGHEVASIKFRGYNEDDINQSIEFASRAAYYLGIPVSGIMKQKTEKRLYTVIRSPFAQAKSKENFWRTTFNYKLVGYDANPEVVDLWLSYMNKYAIEGVNYNAKVTTRELVNFVDELDQIKPQDLKIPEGFKDSDDPIMSKVEELLQSLVFQQHFTTQEPTQPTKTTKSKPPKKTAKSTKANDDA